MITKRVLVVFALVAGFGWFVYGGGVYEEDVPMPEVQYDLPQAIVGKFTIIAPMDEYSITIYPNNKYILFIR
ncbi:MAG: hypothetical protein LBU00_08285 [Treponema sp.]|jgi:hypothetical protein|nr:hypothetical protein [Treponema sp.]